jgi:hypothetical protein
VFVRHSIETSRRASGFLFREAIQAGGASAQQPDRSLRRPSSASGGFRSPGGLLPDRDGAISKVIAWPLGQPPHREVDPLSVIATVDEDAARIAARLSHIIGTDDRDERIQDAPMH